VSFQELVSQVIADALGSVRGFMPELILCATIVVMLLARMLPALRRLHASYWAFAGTLVALYHASPWVLLAGLRDSPAWQPELFTGLLVYDELTVFFRSLLLGFLLLFLILTRLTGLPDREDSADFYTLILGGIVGMCLMASANHLVMVFLAVEMASVPSYVLAGIVKGRRRASEAALKYAVYGAGAAGVMLYGISLLAGVLGTCHLPTMAVELASLPAERASELAGVLMMGGLFVMVGLAFKLSAVPFHFWCPDVFEGATAEVNAFLSVASKAAALGLLLRVALGLGHVPATKVSVLASMPAAQVHSVAYRAQASEEPPPVRAGRQADTKGATHEPRGRQRQHEALPRPADARERLQARLAPARRYMLGLVALVAAITCTFGNLAAFGQTNIKRLLAYSTIAHAGYMMMPVAAAIWLAGRDTPLAQNAVAAVAIYAGMYLFMNLGAFAIVAFLRNEIGSEEIADYAGLVRRAPGMVVCFSIILVSLLGIPPLSGFFAKYAAFYALATGNHTTLYLLLFVGVLNTVISLVYYVRVIKVMTMDPEPEGRLPVSLSLVTPAGIYAAVMALAVFALGLWPNQLAEWARRAAERLLS
jgi:NADH-quinone oxidoreductase subunit N